MSQLFSSRRFPRKFFLAAALFATAFPAIVLAQSPGAEASKLASNKIPTDRLDVYSGLAVEWMRQYLRIDTTNPPGNEARAAAFFKKILDEEGIENQIFEFAPGRANLWARVQGGAKRPLILLNHMDVVSSDPEHWEVPPFSGEIVNGSIYGRGTQDMKNEAIAQLVVLVMLHREKVALDRDVIFLATADEEVGNTGTDWMLAHHRELLGNAEYLITEGGYNMLEDGRMQYLGIDVAEKAAFWLRVTAHGKPGHASQPLADSAPNRLVRALDRILKYQTPLKLTPVMEEFLRVMAPRQPPARAELYRNIRSRLTDPGFIAQLPQDDLNPRLRNTIALTMLGGAQQTNVIPSEAWANLDVRLLPDEDPGAFLAELKRVVDDPNVTVEPLSQDFSGSNSSSTDTALFDAIRRVAKIYFPGAPVVPSLTSGYTENQRFRAIGIVSYGFSPYAVTGEESATEHGNNERIRVEEVRRGPRLLFDVVMEVAARR